MNNMNNTRLNDKHVSSISTNSGKGSTKLFTFFLKYLYE